MEVELAKAQIQVRTCKLDMLVPVHVSRRPDLYTLMRRNAASPTDFFCLPPARVFEIGTAIET
jgi:K+ transporter